MGKITKLGDIEVYKEALTLTSEIYALTRSYKLRKDFALVDQVRRASISIAANIAEGYGRKSKGDFCRFLSISLGSVNEVITYLDFISFEYKLDTKLLTEKFNKLASRVASFRKYLTTNYKLPTANQ